LTVEPEGRQLKSGSRNQQALEIVTRFRGFPFCDLEHSALEHSWGTQESENVCSFCTIVIVVDNSQTSI
jgi:hypothetical protein